MGGGAQIVEHSKHEAISSNPSAYKKKKKKRLVLDIEKINIYMLFVLLSLFISKKFNFKKRSCSLSFFPSV
jgi:hypothetical protein